jgi:hypothetical protein
MIERNIPKVGGFTPQQLSDAARKSNCTLAELAPRVQWVHSYVAADKTFCVYLAENEEAIREHAKRSGFPANVITEIKGMIDPTTAGAGQKAAACGS